MPEDPETRRRLDRLIARERRRGLIRPALVVLPVLLLLAVLLGPFERAAEPEMAVVVAAANIPSDDLPRRSLTVRMADGSIAVITLRPNLAPAVGANACVVRVRHALTGGTRVQPAAPGTCGS